MNANRNCTANFAINSITLSVSKTGNGTVMSAPAGINCGTACSYKFAAGSSELLHATPAPGFTFTGWSSAECPGTADCNVTLSPSTAVTAHFLSNLADKIGVYRPSTGEWFLDRNGNAEWDGCNVDLCVRPFAGSDAVPVVGDWNGSGVTKVGLFMPDASQWRLDANGNGIWDGCGIDICIDSFGQSADVPVVGQWTSAGHDWIGVFRPAQATWHLDVNTNGILDSCRKEKCLRLSVYANGDLPVTGDWTGRGTTQLGFFRPSTGQWFLDVDADGAWDGCSKDLCISSFGTSGDVPVSGDWNGTGKSKIGVFRPSTGEWFLDLNGNGKWDGPAIDLYVPGYGQQGDVPVVGRW
jgi:List-Bact-rpt repeat protein